MGFSLSLGILLEILLVYPSRPAKLDRKLCSSGLLNLSNFGTLKIVIKHSKNFKVTLATSERHLEFPKGPGQAQSGLQIGRGTCLQQWGRRLLWRSPLLTRYLPAIEVPVYAHVSI